MRPRKRSLTVQQLVAVVAVATGAIMCVLFAAILWLLNVSSSSLDRTQMADEAKLLRSLVNDYEKSLSMMVADYSSWTEMYDYLNGPRNQAWDDANLGPYISASYGMDEIQIVSREGRVVYSYLRQPRSEMDQRMVRDTQATAYLARLAFAREVPLVQKPVSGFMTLNGVPCIVIASTVRDSAVKEPSHFALLEIRMLNPAALHKLSYGYGITQLRPERARSGGLALNTPDGARAPFRLFWNPSKDGRALFNTVLPVVLLIGAFVLAAFLALARISMRILAHIRVSEQRFLKAELQTSYARAHAAEETARSKSAFIANMSHELRTPLNAILGFSDLMRLETLGPIGVAKYRSYIDDIHLSGTHLLNVVNDILQISKIEAGKYEPQLGDIALDETVRESLRMADILAQQKSIRFEIQIPPAPCMVAADAQALKQIVLNLLSNAVKFSPQGSSVGIVCDDAGADYILRISDQGCGIPEETLKELGKPFVQAEGAYNRKYQGAGLGLAICFLLARAMSGSIQIESMENKGTTVSVRIPKSKTWEQLQAAAA